jgi:hypothetical protein
MSRYTNYGPGDSETWPAYSGNPNDPRAPEPTAEEYENEARMDALTTEEFHYADFNRAWAGIARCKDFLKSLP